MLAAMRIVLAGDTWITVPHAGSAKVEGLGNIKQGPARNCHDGAQKTQRMAAAAAITGAQIARQQVTTKADIQWEIAVVIVIVPPLHRAPSEAPDHRVALHGCWDPRNQPPPRTPVDELWCRVCDELGQVLWDHKAPMPNGRSGDVVYRLHAVRATPRLK